MEVVVSNKGKGVYEFSSESVLVTLKLENLGLPEPKTLEGRAQGPARRDSRSAQSFLAPSINLHSLFLRALGSPLPEDEGCYDKEPCYYLAHELK